jgi:hypothetical protein
VLVAGSGALPRLVLGVFGQHWDFNPETWRQQKSKQNADCFFSFLFWHYHMSPRRTRLPEQSNDAERRAFFRPPGGLCSVKYVKAFFGLHPMFDKGGAFGCERRGETMKDDTPSSRFIPHAESWALSEYIWDDVRLVATSDPRRTSSHASTEAQGRVGKPGKSKTSLACKIEGCPEICDRAYTARSRVCLTHMKAGSRNPPQMSHPTRVSKSVPPPSHTKNMLYDCAAVPGVCFIAVSSGRTPRQRSPNI